MSSKDTPIQVPPALNPSAQDFSPRFVGTLYHPAKTPNSCEGDASAHERKNTLRLLFLGCERRPPYGPVEHTSRMILNVIRAAVERHGAAEDDDGGHERKGLPRAPLEISFDMYDIVVDGASDSRDHATPSLLDWDGYDGIILPGSFSGAYDNDPWIRSLRHVLRTRVWSRFIPTLGICFGHQVLAHALPGGRACSIDPEGIQKRYGRRRMELTSEGRKVLRLCLRDEKGPSLLYTHGDMVETLPNCAVCLGGDEQELAGVNKNHGGVERVRSTPYTVPVHAAAYFRTEEDADTFRTTGKGRPWAVTVQGHPEYVTLGGRNVSFPGILEMAVKEYADVSAVRCCNVHVNEAMAKSIQKDTEEHFMEIETGSIGFIADAMITLGWM
mmetsp:Transcript_14387/g.31507  ORF Transcript_14387/g.31507 Transcript_14387/m.31507 type:complete len:385 (-) Transcript_14387:129-1283(-)